MVGQSVVETGFDKSENLTSQLQMMKIPLMYGTAYFNTLTKHAINIRTMQREQIRKMEETMRRLGRGLGEVTTPTKLSGQKCDLDLWRRILQHFLDANILKTHGESDHGNKQQCGPIQRLLKLQMQVLEIEKVSPTFYSSPLNPTPSQQRYVQC